MANHQKNAGAGKRRLFKHRAQGPKASGRISVPARRRRQREIEPEPIAEPLKASLAHVARLAYSEIKPNTGPYTRLLLAYFKSEER